MEGDRLGIRHELYRKSIHLGSAVIPLLVWVLPRGVGIALLAVAVATALGIEWARRRARAVRRLFLRWTGGLLREREREGLSGATYMAIGYLAAAVLFPLHVAVAAMLYNALGDGIAAVVGKRWGRHRIRSGKSLEGAVAGFAANVAVGSMIPGIPLPAAIVGGGVAALLELLPIPVDDNLSVTLGGGAALWVGIGLASSFL